MTLYDVEPPEIEGFSEFFRDFGLRDAFQKWAEMAGGSLRELAFELFSIECKF